MFDGMFLADIVGVYDVYQGSPAPAIATRVQMPVNDPLMLISAMAAVTKHLGFGVTVNLTYEPPYPVRAAHVDARSSDQGPDRLEHRHRLSRQRRPRHGLRRSSRSMTAATTRPRNTWRWSTSSGKASWEDDAVLRDKAARRLSPIPPKCARPSRRQVLPDRRHPSLRAVAAAHAGALSGRRLGPRAATSPHATPNASSSPARIARRPRRPSMRHAGRGGGIRPRRRRH